MNRTERLFDTDAKLGRFYGVVLECEQNNDDTFNIVLDKTAFFPNEGGQACDTGMLSDLPVLDVNERNGQIIHTLKSALEVGEQVFGQVDIEQRFRKMQNHTGEHIISGLIHRHFGYNNVGFHLGKDDVTCDFDGELSEDDVRKIEYLANDIVFRCVPVKTYYPSAEELKTLEYRSKLELTDNVRIVEIEGEDMCACCAPHVSNTGEVGLIKILDYIRYKGGVRIHIQCGFDALEDYISRYARIRKISNLISVKQDEVDLGVEKLLDENGKLRGTVSALKREILSYKLEKIEFRERSLCLFEDIDDMLMLRNFVNQAVLKTARICAVFSGNDNDGYKYIIASHSIDLKKISAEINKAICGRGGGSSLMLQGSCTAKRSEIESFFNTESL